MRWTEQSRHQRGRVSSAARRAATYYARSALADDPRPAGARRCRVTGRSCGSGSVITGSSAPWMTTSRWLRSLWPGRAATSTATSACDRSRAEPSRSAFSDCRGTPRRVGVTPAHACAPMSMITRDLEAGPCSMILSSSPSSLMPTTASRSLNRSGLANGGGGRGGVFGAVARLAGGPLARSAHWGSCVWDR
jgi:hypothetical protein